jgi:hypothetical protein
VLGTVSTLGFATSVLRFLRIIRARRHAAGWRLPPPALSWHSRQAAIAGLARRPRRRRHALPALYAEPARMAPLALPACRFRTVSGARGWVVLALILPYIIRPS